MLKLLKALLVLVGLVGVGVTIYYLVNTAWNMQQIIGAIEAMRSREYADPMPTVYLTVGIAAAAALLLGLGIALPSRTAGGIRRDALQAAAKRREAEIRGRADATPHDPVSPEPDATDRPTTAETGAGSTGAADSDDDGGDE